MIVYITLIPLFFAGAVTACAQAQGATLPAKKTAPASAVAKKTTPAAAQPSAVGNSIVDTLVKMIKAKLPDVTIIAKARESSTQLNVDDLIQLKEAGASDGLLIQLSGHGSASNAPPQQAPSAQTRTVAVAAAAPLAPATPAPVTGYNTDLASLKCEAPLSQRKRIIALQTFEFGAMQTTDQAVLNTHAAIGKGISALAVKRIQDGGKFRVVERENIKAVLAEQDFGASSRTKQGTQVKIGRVLGADAILMGTITVFGRDDEKNKAGGIGRTIGKLGEIGVKWGKDKAVVAINYRLVDAETSETIGAGEARGESKRESKSIDLGTITGSGGGVGGIDMTSANFAQTIIGEATIDCVNKLIEILNQKETAIKLRDLGGDIRIAEVSGPQVYIASGSADGVQKCDRFEVSQVVKEIHDPVTKELLDLQLQKVGDLIVTEVREKLAIGFYNGTAPPAVGYAVRKAMPPEPPTPPSAVEKQERSVAAQAQSK